MIIIKNVAFLVFLLGMLNMLLAIIIPHSVSLKISGRSFSLFGIAITLMTASLGVMLYISSGN
jgi:hypothetical protein